MNPQKIVLLARTQDSRRFRLDSKRVSKANREVNNRRLTRRGDFSSIVHNDIKHISDRGIVVVEVVRSRDGRQRMRCHVLGGNGTDLVQEGLKSGLVDSDSLGRHVVFGTSVDRDIVSLSGLQNESHEFVNDAVHIQAPDGWRVQKSRHGACCGVSN